ALVVPRSRHAAARASRLPRRRRMARGRRCPPSAPAGRREQDPYPDAVLAASVTRHRTLCPARRTRRRELAAAEGAALTREVSPMISKRLRLSALCLVVAV